MGVDATDLFDRYEEDYEDVVGGGVPHLEINKMHISQSIEVTGCSRLLHLFFSGVYYDMCWIATFVATVKFVIVVMADF